MGERTSPRGGYSLTLTEILNRLEGVKGGHGQYTARCPAHDDRRNSLSVSVGEGGRILLHCHAGCSVRDIAGAMGLTVKDLFTEEHKPSPAPLLKYMEETGAGRDEILYVGDSSGDGKCASATGVDFACAVWGAHEDSHIRAQYHPETPAELARMLLDA